MLLDTSGLLALLHKGEPHHSAAVNAFDARSHRFTHSYILAELIPLAATRRYRRDLTLDFSRRIVTSGEVDVVWVSESMHQQGLDLLFARSDKNYSLCDAISFVLMRERAISDALTTDHHFEQEGFRRLLA